MNSGAPVLEMLGITKRFPGALALNRVSLQVRRGEILALMGENGAGKSTLIKILGGAQLPDEGEIRMDGSVARIRSVAAAQALGISVINQELMLAPNLDVAGNIFLGRERSKHSLLDRKRMESEAEQLLQKVGLAVSPRTLVGSLTTGQMQMVEICKALSQKARILILDEPTASLSLQESERLLQMVTELKAAGISMLYVSHRMEEVRRIADRVAVLRDGCSVGELEIAKAKVDDIVSMMVGRTVNSRFPERKTPIRDAVPFLSVKDLVVPGASTGVSFEAHRGEILGFAGVVGSGRTELMRVLAGVTYPTVPGQVILESAAYAPASVAEAIRQGVYLVPEDRKLHGLVLPMSIAANISLPSLRSYLPRWRFNFERQKTVATDAVSRLRIRPTDIDRPVVGLSGGNQQKVVLAKWLAMHPRLLILDEPTRGVDVGAKAEIYARISELAEGGLTILLVSSDLEEILGLSDRVVVMRNRTIVATLDREQISMERIGFLMTSEGGNA